MLNWGMLDDVADKFYGIDAEKSVKKLDQISNNGLERGKNYESTGKVKTKAEIDLEIKELKELKERVVTMMRRLPTYLFLEENQIDSIDDIMYTNNVELFKDTVGITIKDFDELCSGFIKTDRLNRCIMAYNQIEAM
jgi:hypothetical protein